MCRSPFSSSHLNLLTSSTIFTLTSRKVLPHAAPKNSVDVVNVLIVEDSGVQLKLVVKKLNNVAAIIGKVPWVIKR